MAKISVIVAVYKAPEYLPRCVEGILAQSFRDLELILVDDGSPDQCGSICDAYGEKDSRVRVIHKQNAGVGAARNTALDWVFANSDSQWIFFHDNDDWIHPQTLERLLDAARKQNTKISICGYQETKGEDPDVAPQELEPVLWEAGAFYREHFINATVCWGKLYHRSCFDGKRYPPGKYIEDEFLTYRLLYAAEQVSVIPAPLYAYFVNPNGITKRNWQPKRLDAWEAYEQQITFFQERGDAAMVSFRLRNYLENAVTNLEAAENSPNAPELAQLIRFMEKRIRRVIRQCWHSGCISFWIDFDILYRAYPLTTRAYRLWLELTEKIRRKGDV